MTFGAVVATSLLNGTQIDAASVTSIAKALVETALAAYLSHWSTKPANSPELAPICPSETRKRAFAVYSAPIP